MSAWCCTLVAESGTNTFTLGGSASAVVCKVNMRCRVHKMQSQSLSVKISLQSCSSYFRILQGNLSEKYIRDFVTWMIFSWNVALKCALGWNLMLIDIKTNNSCGTILSEICRFIKHYTNRTQIESYPSGIHWKKKVEPKRLQGGAIFMSTGWPPFRYRFSTTLQSGTVFYHFGQRHRFFSNMIIKEKMAPLLKSAAVF